MASTASYYEEGIRPFKAVGAIGANLRVKLSAGLVDVAGVADREIGTARVAAFKANDPVAVLLRNKPGTVPMVAAGAITLNAAVYAAASGKISATASSVFVGIALAAASGNNSIIEVLRAQPLTGASLTDVAGTIFRLAAGEVTLGGANPTAVATGLATIVAAGVVRKATTAPALDPDLFSVFYTGTNGTLNVYAWKPTASGDCTMIASTNSTAVLCWWAYGT